MTEDVPWAQQLVDKHASNILNLIRKLPLHEKVLQLLELEAKQLVADVASDALNEGKDICMKALDGARIK